jgi:hypothetical protein
LAKRNPRAGKKTPEKSQEPPPTNPYVAMLFAWLVPGAGHAFVGRLGRGLAFFVVVLTTLVIGCRLDGQLSNSLTGHPLEVLRTFGCLGLGLPYFVTRWGFGYTGQSDAPGFEYGNAFILTAGLMNLLLLLDAWDIAVGRKG